MLRVEQPGQLSEVLLQPGPQAFGQPPQVEEMLAPESRHLLPQVWEEQGASAEQAAPV